ncbi:MAG: PEGA domain-containing protein, partial [Spirochaetaceae bacterium]|nr:PEGA domain-containing protein [Spirochaetaceae bacterium]
MKNLRTPALFLLLACTVFMAWPDESEKGSQSMAAEAAQCPGMAIVAIRTDVNGSYIIVDGVYFGMTSWNGQLRPGMHSVLVTAEDHYPAHFYFTLQENMKYVISIHLDPHTGLLSVMVYPEDAELTIDGRRIQRGLQEVPVGKHSLVARKFGFEEQSLKIYIARNKTSYIQMQLKPSRFELEHFKISPSVVNPENKGAYGRAHIAFSVTGPGFGSLEVKDEESKTIRSLKLDEFSTWSQDCFWDGKDDSGRQVQDGTYELLLTLWPLRMKQDGLAPPMSSPSTPAMPPIELPVPPIAPHLPMPQAMPDPLDESYSRPLKAAGKVRIDSGLRLFPAGAVAARPGLQYCADPKVRELLPFSIDFQVFFGSGFGAATDISFKAGKDT